MGKEILFLPSNNIYRRATAGNHCARCRALLYTVRQIVHPVLKKYYNLKNINKIIMEK
jgi:hypothetical protein